VDNSAYKFILGKYVIIIFC